jgi:hypothetical protein
MKFTRRALFELSGRIAVFLGLGLFSPRAVARKPLEPAKRRTLVAFLDTLIPDDETGPGASLLGVDGEVLRKSTQNNGEYALLVAGLHWLDEQARSSEAAPFAELTEEGREGVVALAAGAEPGSLPRRFFERIRSDAFYFYYAHPRAWAAIGYDGPPQPEGFLDYAQPPTAPRQ